MALKSQLGDVRFFSPYLYVLLTILGVYTANESVGVLLVDSDFAFAAGLIAIILVTVLVGNRLLKDRDRVLALIVPAEFLFFNFTLVRNQLSEVGIPQASLVLVLLSAALFLVWFKKTGQINSLRLIQLNRAACVVILVMVAYYMGLALINEGPEKKKFGFETVQGFEASKVPGDKPDVYYILLDGYNRADILKRYYGFDNSAFLNHLEERGFYVATQSHSNYAHSFLSISSTFKGRYIHEELIKKFGRSSKNRSLPHSWLRDNEVFETFRTMDYSMANSSSWELTDSSPDNDQRLPGSTGFWLADNLELGTISQIMLDNSLLHFANRQGDYPKLARGIKNAFRNANLVADNKKSTFSFIHILAPHPPYYFDKNGKLLTKKPIHSLEDWNDTKSFVEQTRYVNKEVSKLIDKLLDQKEKPVIILSSDHGGGSQGNFGPLDKESDEFLLERFANLTAIYLPGQRYDSLYATVSPVNHFRVVLNDQFGQDLPLLPDRQIYEPIKALYDFVDVTTIVNKAEKTGVPSGDPT